MAPTTQKQWSVSGTDKGFDGLQFVDAEVPKCGENEVLVQMRGASLNYRDLIIPKVRDSDAMSAHGARLTRHG